jgi:hypothetical protein
MGSNLVISSRSGLIALENLGTASGLLRTDASFATRAGMVRGSYQMWGLSPSLAPIRSETLMTMRPDLPCVAINFSIQLS